MIILGLGSNLGDSLGYLRHALNLLKKTLTVQQVSPLYMSDALLPENAPPSWNKPYFNLALRCDTHLSPYELLEKIKKIEVIVGREPGKDWGPRVIDIDILAWDDFIQYDEKLHIPHEHLLSRPFALWPLADVAPRWIHPIAGKTATELVLPWGSRFSDEAPLHTRQIQQRIDTPQLVGILNLTPDSFSDGGKFGDIDIALHHFYKLVAEGADIIDIGAEATGPNAQMITSEEEWKRLEPVLKSLQLEKMLIRPKISIDTRSAETAKKVLECGVNWINDVSGLQAPEMRKVVARANCDIVIMHHRGIPVDKNNFISRHHDPVTEVYQWAENQIHILEKADISRERIIFDVGIGYGKTAEQSLELLNRIHEFRKLQTRLLVGHSRKSFLQQFTAQSAVERDIETLSCSLYLAEQSVDYLRVHHVDSHARAFKVARNLCASTFDIKNQNIHYGMK